MFLYQIKYIIYKIKNIKKTESIKRSMAHLHIKSKISK